MKLSEIKLSVPVQEYLEGLGYKVYFEIPELQRVVDIIAVKENEIVAVELKMGYCKKALYQARMNTLFADKSYIAVKSKPRNENILKCGKRNVGILLVRDKVIVLSESTPTTYGPMEGQRKSALESCERNKDNTQAGLPCLKGVGPAIEVSSAVYEYTKLNPNASWKEIYANVPNHYASAASMRQSMEKQRHREYLKEKYSDKKCGQCYRITDKWLSCPKSRNRRKTSKACIDFIEPEPERNFRMKIKSKLLILLILFCFLCSGCKAVEYRGTIKSYDPNGLLVKHTEVRTNKAAMIKDGPIEFDGRGVSGWIEFLKGLMQIVTLGIIAD